LIISSSPFPSSFPFGLLAGCECSTKYWGNAQAPFGAIQTIERSKVVVDGFFVGVGVLCVCGERLYAIVVKWEEYEENETRSTNRAVVAMIGRTCQGAANVSKQRYSGHLHIEISDVAIIVISISMVHLML
jgi:hypothetical protein